METRREDLNLEEPDAETTETAEIAPQKEELQSEGEPVTLDKRVGSVLEVQDVQLERREAKKPGGVLSRLGEWARSKAGALLLTAASVSPFLAIGCKTESHHPKLPTEEQKMEMVEKESDSLFDALKGFTFSEDHARVNPGFVIDVGGGNYYRLDSEKLDLLSKTSAEYAEKIEHTDNGSPNSKALVSKLKQAEHMKMVEEIKNLGQKVDTENLPPELKEAESARQETKRDMGN